MYLYKSRQKIQNDDRTMRMITAVVNKPKAESKLGITFSRRNMESPMVIETIRDDGIFASSELKAGMIVESIMKIPMKFKTPKFAEHVLRSADAGQVEVKAKSKIRDDGTIIAIVDKPREDSKLGITFSRLNMESPMIIETIHDDGIFASSDLKAGMIVESIMGIPMEFKTPKFAEHVLRSTEAGQVDLKARVKICDDGTIIAIVDKPREDSKLGITFSRLNMESPMIIEMIQDGSLFASSDLKAGMIVESIMGIPMEYKTPKFAVDILKSTDGGQIEMKVRGKICEVIKTDKEQKVGISLTKSIGKPGIFVQNISEDGLMAKTELREGDKVLYINDIPCPPTVEEAIALVNEAGADILKLVAVPPPTEKKPSLSTRVFVQSTRVFVLTVH